MPAWWDYRQQPADNNRHLRRRVGAHLREDDRTDHERPTDQLHRGQSLIEDEPCRNAGDDRLGRRR